MGHGAVCGKEECVGSRVFEQESWASGEDQINIRLANINRMKGTQKQSCNAGWCR